MVAECSVPVLQILFLHNVLESYFRGCSSATTTCLKIVVGGVKQWHAPCRSCLFYQILSLVAV